MGREDDPGWTSEIPCLDNRASGGLRVKSGPFPYWRDASVPRVRRAADAFDADREGGGGSRSSHPGRPDRGVRRSVLEGPPPR